MSSVSDLTAPLLDRCAFPEPGSTVTVAVSGGPDSMALLVLAIAAGCHVLAIHVDHGLRPGSDAEADVVAAAADRFGARFRAERVLVADGPNLEERARIARSAVLPSGVLTGHTAEDQAETVLLAIMRGAGIHGLAGVGDPHRRPLLRLRRSETEQLCRDVGIDPVCDPSNRDPRFRRNRVRHELLPLISDIAERDPVALLVRLAEHATGAASVLDETAATIDPTDCRALARCPLPIARTAVRTWLIRESGRSHPPDLASVDRVLAVVRGDSRGTEIIGGGRVLRTKQRLRFEPAHRPTGR